MEVIHGRLVKEWRHCAYLMTRKILRSWGSLQIEPHIEDLQDIADMGLAQALYRFDEKKSKLSNFLYYQLLEGCRSYVKESCKVQRHTDIFERDIGYWPVNVLESRTEIGKYFKLLSKREKEIVTLLVFDNSLAEIGRKLKCTSSNIIRIRKLIQRKYIEHENN